ncbi:MAG TPA: HlyD family efflux transporter periplasmic adaptor subunit [Blastocatellia bacterium]|nr:HlyD family efflux transporter periplasmic adaptor subunit [Blastocatellia bacterium]
MDIPRKSAARKKKIKQAIYLAVAIVVVGGITVGVSRLERADPTADGGTLLMDTVKRGSMVRQVRGLGTLLPLEIQLVPALSEGRIAKKLVQQGEHVKSDTILVELTNPVVEQAALDAESQFRAAEADTSSLKVQLEKELLDQKSSAANVEAQYKQARLEADVIESLYKQELKSKLERDLAEIKAKDLETRNELEQKRLSIAADEARAKLKSQEEKVDQLKQNAALKRHQVEQLKIRAGIDGILQLLFVEVGQQVTPGFTIARVYNPNKLKAELKVAETQVKDIALGQDVTIDTRNGVIQGKVIRIDPAAQNGTVTVDSSLEGELPKAARPELSVDGTIQLEKLDDILYVGRPVHGQERSTVGLFKVDPDGVRASRVQVKLGRSSVVAIEVVDGLKEGDRIILSDTSQWDSAERIRLK